MDTIYGEARGGNLAGAWQTIERELALQNYAFEYYDWLLERLDRLDNRRLAARLAQDYITRALGRDNARVTRLVQRCLAADPRFRPRSGAETLRVAELSRLAGDRSSAQALLVDFEQHFPGDRGSRPPPWPNSCGATDARWRHSALISPRGAPALHTRQVEHQHLGLPALAKHQGAVSVSLSASPPASASPSAWICPRATCT